MYLTKTGFFTIIKSATEILRLFLSGQTEGSLVLHVVLTSDLADCPDFAGIFAITEQKRCAPDGRNGYKNVDHSAQEGCCPAEKPCDKVKLENPDKTPVNAANNQERKTEFIPDSVSTHKISYLFL